jgi:hypothetical protein
MLASIGSAGEGYFEHLLTCICRQRTDVNPVSISQLLAMYI